MKANHHPITKAHPHLIMDINFLQVITLFQDILAEIIPEFFSRDTKTGPTENWRPVRPVVSNQPTENRRPATGHRLANGKIDWNQPPVWLVFSENMRYLLAVLAGRPPAFRNFLPKPPSLLLEILYALFSMYVTFLIHFETFLNGN